MQQKLLLEMFKTWCHVDTDLQQFLINRLMRICLQCFDTVGWAAGRASGLQKTEWWGAGVVICLERGADLHTAQLMPLPLTVCCFSNTQIGFTLPFWYRLTRVVPEKGPLNGCMTRPSCSRRVTVKCIGSRVTQALAETILLQKIWSGRMRQRPAGARRTI